MMNLKEELEKNIKEMRVYEDETLVSVSFYEYEDYELKRKIVVDYKDQPTSVVKEYQYDYRGNLIKYLSSTESYRVLYSEEDKPFARIWSNGKYEEINNQTLVDEEDKEAGYDNGRRRFEYEYVGEDWDIKGEKVVVDVVDIALEYENPKPVYTDPEDGDLCFDEYCTWFDAAIEKYGSAEWCRAEEVDIFVSDESIPDSLLEIDCQKLYVYNLKSSKVDQSDKTIISDVDISYIVNNFPDKLYEKCECSKGKKITLEKFVDEL